MLATQVLPEDLSENTEKEDDDVEIVGYIVIKDSRFEIKKGETKIGRDPTMCSVVIENFTVSKVHAFIESDGIDETFIYDAGSTNFTKLGKKTLRPHCRYKLEDNSNITFGNITAKFIVPPKISENSESKTNLDNFNAPKGLEDIFDAVTQVTVPQPHTSGEVFQLENQSKNIQIFKIPDLADSGEKSKESLSNLSPKSSEDSVNPSSIFSLSTQCQLIQPLSKEIKSDDKVSSGDHRNNKLDSVKSFLDDDEEDSILCAFMSLHSPSGKAASELPVQIKTESIQEHCTELFEAQTQVQPLTVHSNSEKNDEATSLFNEDLSVKNSLILNIRSSQLENGSKFNNTSTVSEDVNNSTKDPEEDFVKTQEFKTNSALGKCGSAVVSDPVDNNAPQEPDTECYSGKTGDLSLAESLSDNEDLICTQKFEVLCKSNKETTSNIPENKELNDSSQDFMETQIYDFERKQNNRENSGEPTKALFIVSETPEKDSEPYMETCNQLTQRNLEEDFIGTQAFSEMTQDKDANVRSSGSSGRNDDDCSDDEDFIATQPVDLLLKSTTNSKRSQTPISIQDASRESSPDLLDSGFRTKTSKEFINIKSEDSFSEFSKKINLALITNVKEELDEDFNRRRERSVERVDSSGDETESDLEIIFDKSDISRKITTNEGLGDRCSNVESQQLEKSTIAGTSEIHENNDSNSSYIFQLDPECPVEFASNPTPTEKDLVQDKIKPPESDSDATDCEDIAVADREIPIEQELPEKITFNETSPRHQEAPFSSPEVSAQMAPNDAPNDDKDSPSFEIGNDSECWSQLSLEMPATQDMRNTVDEIIHKCSGAATQDPDPKREEADYETPSKILKTEVKTSGSNSVQSKTAERQADSPLKRLGNSSNESEAVPAKKSKIEPSDRILRSSDKQLLKLWQVHSFAQIQPSRTRSSLKNGEPANKLNKTDSSLGNNNSNQFATSRRVTSAKKNTRKLSFDITPYLCKKVETEKRTLLEGKKNETPPKENRAQSKPIECCHRVLRSSTRNNGRLPLESATRQVLTRSRRNSRIKEEEFLGNPCVNVVFTGFDSESLERIIFELGGKKTNDLSLGDVVVADKIRRTVKFLSAIALSLPVTSPQWLLASREEKRLLNPWNFILKDEESERKWGFQLKTSLERSKNVKLMQGLSVFATANAKPPMKDLMAIVKYCGGTPLFQPPDVWPKKTVIVSCPEDKKYWPLPKFRNVKIVHYEFVLIGVLRQKLDFNTYKLR